MKKPEFKKPNIKMNINYEFTKREKGLLYILGMALLIMAALYLVFFPGINKYQALSEERSEAEFKQQEMEMAIACQPIRPSRTQPQPIFRPKKKAMKSA